MEEDDRILGRERYGVGQADLVTLAAHIVSAYVSSNRVPVAEVPALLSSVHAAVAGLGAAASDEVGPEKPTPAQIRRSITPEALISFIDGKPYKTLKRHLTGNGLTMDGYREHYGLPRDYPSTAAIYSEQRSALAKSLGLGQQRRNAALKKAALTQTTPDAADIGAQGEAAISAGKPASARKPRKATTVE